MKDLLVDEVEVVEYIEPLPARQGIASDLAIVERILRNRRVFFAEIRDEIGLRDKIISMLVASFVFLGLYGGVMGASNSVPQVFSSALKLPLLFVVTLFICAPSLYFFNILFGSRQSILQNIALILTAMTTTSVLLVSLAPVTLFFLTTTSEYQFFKLLNVAIFTIAGSMGLVFLKQGFEHSVDAENEEGRGARRLLFVLWMLLYAFVGTQMAWTLRPFMGAPNEPFMIVRQVGGNFYANIIESIAALFGSL
jgi:hypothetical protein